MRSALTAFVAPFIYSACLACSYGSALAAAPPSTVTVDIVVYLPSDTAGLPVALMDDGVAGQIQASGIGMPRGNKDPLTRVPAGDFGQLCLGGMSCPDTQLSGTMTKDMGCTLTDQIENTYCQYNQAREMVAFSAEIAAKITRTSKSYPSNLPKHVVFQLSYTDFLAALVPSTLADLTCLQDLTTCSFSLPMPPSSAAYSKLIIQYTNVDSLIAASEREYVQSQTVLRPSH